MCSWKDVAPVTPAPTGGKCFPLDASSTDVVKQTCSAATDVTACAPAMCIWKIAADPNTTPVVTPVDPVPTGPQYHCVSIDTTIPVAADNCMNIKVMGDCSNLKDTCKWEEVKSTTPVDTKPLFSIDFCHPVVVSKTTLPSVWDACTK